MPRLSLKKSFSHAGFVKIDNSYYPCQVSEFTRIGAKVRLEVMMGLPDKFSMQFTRDGRVSRACSLISQDRYEAYVSFDQAAIGQAV